MAIGHHNHTRQDITRHNREQYRAVEEAVECCGSGCWRSFRSRIWIKNGKNTVFIFMYIGTNSTKSYLSIRMKFTQARNRMFNKPAKYHLVPRKTSGKTCAKLGTFFLGGHPFFFHSVLKTEYNVHTHSVIFNKVLLLTAGEGGGGNDEFQSTEKGNAPKKVGNLWLNPRPDGPLDFPPRAGGVFEHPPSISAPAHCRTKRKTAFESSRKIISKSFRSFFGWGKNWGHQGSKFQNFPKRFLDDKIFNFKGRETILIPSCLSRQGASNHV